jgi:hypothetical protein
MTVGNFDLEALIRAIGISLGIGLIVATIGYFVMRKSSEWSRWKHVLTMGIIGIVIILTFAIYYAWPSLVNVPSLDDLSQAEAEDLLVKRRLIPEARPQYAAGVDAGRVIPHSQSPVAGLPVRPETPVSFAVNVRDERPSMVQVSSDALAAMLFQPATGGNVICSRGGDNVYRFEVRGTSSGLSPDRYGLLLWVKPVRPPSETAGWYLQRPPVNGIHRIEADGGWIGIAQIGNATWPPHEGDALDLAVTLADRDAINKLMAESGVAIYNQPLGISSQTAHGVVVTIKK